MENLESRYIIMYRLSGEDLKVSITIKGSEAAWDTFHHICSRIIRHGEDVSGNVDLIDGGTGEILACTIF